MNWPNRLSVIRVLCIPLITLLLYFSASWCRWAAAVLFALACFTDFLDGHLARKNNWITDFGKFIDPVADKLLVLSAFIMLIHLGLVPAWLVILILARELAVDGLRMIAGSKGQVIAAAKLGKLKTVSQMFYIILLFLVRVPVLSHPLLLLATFWILAITLWSGTDYFLKNQSVFK